jgi:hypothetical protein
MALEINTKELPRFCPLCGKEIKCIECYEIGMVAERLFPDSELPPELKYTEEMAAQCNACKYHID